VGEGPFLLEGLDEAQRNPSCGLESQRGMTGTTRFELTTSAVAVVRAVWEAIARTRTSGHKMR